MTQTAPIPSSLECPVPVLIKDKESRTSVTLSSDTILPATSRDAVPTSELENLASVTDLFITRKLRLRDAMLFRGKRNRFYVTDSDQAVRYKVEEGNKWWTGYLCLGLRPLVLKICNTEGDQILKIHRPFACTARVMPCQLQRAYVYDKTDNLIGSIEQIWSVLVPEYLVKDGEGHNSFKILGPRVTVGCFTDIVFQIEKCDGSPVGAICKHWRGLNQALFTATTHKFSITFDKDLEVEHKAILFASTLLLDYMYF